jgi:hypothetical protein
MTYKTLIALALASPDAQLHELDANVAGAYVVSFDATGVATTKLANAALDVFSRSVAVKELEAFEFHVLDPRQSYKVVNQDDAESYSYKGKGDIDGPHRADWKVAAFRVTAKGPLYDSCDLGTVTVGGVNLKEMAEAAVGLLWDDRLRSSGLTPVVERAHPETPELEATAQEGQR